MENREYRISDFRIISGECDELLFCCSDYKEAVTEAINEIFIFGNYEFLEKNIDKVSIKCNKESVMFFVDGQLFPSVPFAMQILRKYDATMDLEVGYL